MVGFITLLSCVFVLMCHGRGYFLPEYGALPDAEKNIISFLFYTATRGGEAAVTFFFLLSGFLVGGKGIERILSKTFDWKSYTIDRGARILPPLFCSITFCAIASIYLGSKPDWGYYIGNLLSLQGIFVPVISGPFWSLAYEVWFYIILALIGIFCLKNKISIKLVMFLLLGFCAWIFTKLQAVYLFAWVIGAAAYFIHIQKLKKRSWILLIFILIISYGLNQIARESRAFSALIMLPHSLCIIILACAGSIFISALSHTYSCNRFICFINQVGTKLAAFSYTLYLTHWTTFKLLQHCGFKKANNLTVQSLLTYIVALLIGMFVAYILYLPFERQTLIIKNYLKQFLNIEKGK